MCRLTKISIREEGTLRHEFLVWFMEWSKPVIQTERLDAAMQSTFGNYAIGRDNNFNLTRMLAALLVLMTHSFVLSTGAAQRGARSRWMCFSSQAAFL